MEQAFSPRPLPRGPHGLERDVVLASQRGRMLASMADAVAAKGYAATTVADVVSGAGVLRRFSQLFRDLHDDARRQFPELQPVPERIYVAAVGAVNELVSDVARERRTAELPQLEDTLLFLQVALFAGRDTAASLGLA